MEEAIFHQVQDDILLSAATRILANTYEAGEKLGVLVDSCKTRDALDNMLWTYKKGSFIPHATELDPQTSRQPIYITTAMPFHNLPNIAALVDVEPPKTIEQKHLIVIFTESGRHINSIRQLYKSLKEANCKLNFIRGT
jgi:DNA polymerase III subunit chi